MLVKWWTFLLPLSSFIPLHRSTRSSSLTTLSRPSLTSRSRLKINCKQIFVSVCSCLWNSLPSDLRHVAQHVTPSRHFITYLELIVSDLSTSLFLSKLKLHLFYCSFPNLVCIHLGYLRTDISFIDHASLFHLILISRSLRSCQFLFLLYIFVY